MSFTRRLAAICSFAMVTALSWAVGIAFVVFVVMLVQPTKYDVVVAAVSAAGAAFMVFAITFVGGFFLASVIALWARLAGGRQLSPWLAGALGFATCATLVAIPAGMELTVSTYPTGMVLLSIAVGGVMGAVTGASFVAISNRGALPPAPDVPMIDAGEA